LCYILGNSSGSSRIPAKALPVTIQNAPDVLKQVGDDTTLQTTLLSQYLQEVGFSSNLASTRMFTSIPFAFL
jgi:hypothetical protein